MAGGKAPTAGPGTANLILGVTLLHPNLNSTAVILENILQAGLVASSLAYAGKPFCIVSRIVINLQVIVMTNRESAQFFCFQPAMWQLEAVVAQSVLSCLQLVPDEPGTDTAD